MTNIPIKEQLIKAIGNSAYMELGELFLHTKEDSLKQTIERSEDKFERRLLEVKTEIIKWMVGLWITQMLAIIAILSAIVIRH